MARLLTLVVAAAIAACLVGAPKPKDAKAPVYMPTAVGTKWVYDDGGKDWTEEVVKAEPRDGETLLTVKRTTDQSEYTRAVAVSEKGVFDRGGREFTYDPVCLFKLPVKAGQSWDVARAPQKFLLGFEGTRTAGPAERVEVPAGTFDAVPVRLATVAPDMAEESVAWWAEGVGVVRFKSDRVDRKLKSFTPGKK